MSKIRIFFDGEVLDGKTKVFKQGVYELGITSITNTKIEAVLGILILFQIFLVG